VEPLNADDRPHHPPPSLWPVGFAVGVACVLVGLIVDPIVVIPIGVAIVLVFGFLWARDVVAGGRTATIPGPPEDERAPTAPAIPAHKGEAAMPEPEPAERFPRSVFLEASTLGLGAVIGGIVTVPAIGFAVLPAFLKQHSPEIDVGPITDFPEGQFVVATFIRDPSLGEVSRRTAYIRNNGTSDGKPSFTIISNRCAHLGCPVQPNGPLFDNKKKVETTAKGEEVTIIPTIPAGGFGCPCHGGQYDTEGNRTAGPPVRGLDRYEYSIKNGRLILGSAYSVDYVKGTGKDARIKKYPLHMPGQHVAGPEFWLWPIPEIRA
jgi:menaquinol-cytochrome c reductase iron-sulfur subunit